MYEFWYDYIKSKCKEKANLCYMDAGSFNVYINMDEIYKEIAEVAETRFDTPNYQLDIPLKKEKIRRLLV